MKRIEAKVLDNREEDPGSEPDNLTNSWLIEGKLDEHVLDWESAQVRPTGIQAEVLETNMTETNAFIVRTHGKSPLTRGDHIFVDVETRGVAL